MKRCSRCSKDKPLSEFYRAKLYADGLTYECKDCMKQSAQRWYAANAERAKARRRSDYAANPEPEREAARERMRLLREDPESRERILASGRRWRHAKYRESAEFREQARVNCATRRARKREAFVEHVLPSEVLKANDGLCGICGDPVDPDDFHVDHIVPLFLGGEHSYANTQPAHPLCNWSKGSRRH